MKQALHLLVVTFFVVGLTACVGHGPAGSETRNDAAQSNSAASTTDSTATGVSAATSTPVGTWKFDGAATFDANKETFEESMAHASEEQRAMMTDMLSKQLAAVQATMTLGCDRSVEVAADKVDPLTGATRQSKQSGTWSADGSTITMVTREEGVEREKTQTWTFEGDRLLYLEDQGGQSMLLVFTRQS